MTHTDWQFWASICRDVLTALSIPITAVVATSGISAWKRQLRGNVEFDLARRALRELFVVRDALAMVRNPFITSSEQAQAIAELPSATGQPPSQVETNEAVYERRWRKVANAYRDLEVTAIEAEVLWGTDTAKSLLSIRVEVGQLLTAIQSFLRDTRKPPKIQDEAMHKRYEVREELIYSVSEEGKPDAFEKSVLERVQKIESSIRERVKLIKPR